MRIVYLKLKGFKRFPLRDLELFEEDFSGNRLIGIIGCNGSGKSSLLRELSPFPSSKEHFYDEGEKEIHIYHNSNLYILKSLFLNKESTFNFILNDEELNISNLVTIQKELIKKHFNLTEDIFDLLIGNTSFSNLNSLQRKKLFNSLTNIDLDKFLDIYDRLKEEEKIENSLLKIHLSNLQVETNKLENKDKYKEFENTRKNLNTYLSELIDMRSFLKSNLESTNLDENINEYMNIKGKMKNIFYKYNSLITCYPFNNIISLNDIFLRKKANIEGILDIKLNEIENVNKEINKLKATKDLNKTNLQNSLKEKEEKIKLIFNEIAIFKNEAINIEEVYSELLKVENALHLILDELESNVNKEFTLEKLQKNEELEKSYKSSLDTLKETLLLEKGKLEHLSNYHLNVNIECPKCNHIFSPSLAERIKSNIENKIAEIEKKQKELSLNLENVIKYLERSRKYFSLLNSYDKIVLSSSALNDLWEYIKNKNLIIENPKSIFNVISLAYTDIRNLRIIETLKKEILNIKELVQQLENTSKLSISELENKYTQLDEEIAILLENKKEVNLNLENIEIAKKVYTIYNKLISMLETKKNDIINSGLGVLLSNLIETFDIEINKVKTNLIEIESKLKSYDNTLHLIEKYKKEIEISKTKLHVLNLLIRELSPKNGLIAKIISEYINNIITYINKIVESILEYNVKLSIINTEESSLDYKFRFTVENKIEVNDISKASSGMKEIIDLAFRLILYKLLNLNNYPLYLDEFGIRLDNIHKSKIHNLIFKFINDTTFSQIFLVTHTDIGIFNFKDTKIIQLS